jgi:hypothetical protein
MGGRTPAVRRATRERESFAALPSHILEQLVRWMVEDASLDR